MKKILALTALILSISLVFTACGREASEPKGTWDPMVPSETGKTAETGMPSLPDLDFEGMDFFEDGYEIVEYKSLSDGDTATFVVGALPTATRFLAVDTPETNSSTSGLQPWALAAKAFTQEKLENAETIILEKDDESDIWDNYDRLLAWVWVDGKLLNYMLVEEGLAYVKYLYGDYKYNPVMISAEAAAQKKDIKIWGEKDPSYDYENKVKEVTLGEAREVARGSNVKLTGVVTARIGSNAFIQDETGAVYIYANRYNYTALNPGIRVELTAKVTEYNGLLELTDIEDKKITAVDEGIEILPMEISLDEVGEDIESRYIRIDGLTVTEVVTSDTEKGYDVHVTDGETKGIIRIDKYLNPYIEPDFFKVGEVIGVIGNIGQYLEQYQIMISGEDDILR